MTISKESTNINFNKYKKKELIQFCKDNNIDYKKSYKKNKLIEVITESQNQHIQQETDNEHKEVFEEKKQIESQQSHKLQQLSQPQEINHIQLLKDRIIEQNEEELEPLDEDDIQQILNIHIDYLEEYKILSTSDDKTNTNTSTSTNTQNKKWNIDKIEFKNMLIYGNNKLNTIDFVNYGNNVVGIMGNNAIGKSSIINIILYGLFDTLGSNFNSVNIVNNNEKTFDIKIHFSHNKDKYIIQKSGKNTPVKSKDKLSEKRITCKVDMTLYKNGEEFSANKRVIEDEIKRVIGTYEDFVLTNVFSNTINFNLMTMTQSNIISKLFNLFNLDIYTTIYKNIRTKVKKIIEQKTFYEGELNTLTRDLEKIDNELENIDLSDFINNNDINNQNIYDIFLSNNCNLSTSSSPQSPSVIDELNKILKTNTNKVNKLKDTKDSYKTKLTKNKKDISVLKTKINELVSPHQRSYSEINNIELTQKELDQYKKDINPKYKDKKFNLIKLESSKTTLLDDKIDSKYTKKQLTNEIKEIEENIDTNNLKKMNENTNLSKITRELNELNILIQRYTTTKNTDIVNDSKTQINLSTISVDKLKRQFKRLPFTYYDDISVNIDEKNKNIKLITKKRKRVKKLKKLNSIPDITIKELLETLTNKSDNINNDDTKIVIDKSTHNTIIKVLKDINTIQNKSDIINKHLDKIKQLEEINRKMDSNIEYKEAQQNNKSLLIKCHKLKQYLTQQQHYLYLTEQLSYHKKLSILNKKIKHTKASEILKYYENKESILKISNNITELEKEINTIRTEKDDITSQLYSLQMKNQKLEYLLNTITKLTSQKTTTTNEVKSKQQNIDQLEYVNRILSTYMELVNTKNIPMTLLKMKLSNIENDINRFLEGVVNFKLEVKESKSKILFSIIKNNKSLSFIQCSSFERFIIQLAVKKALTSNSYVNKSNFFIIDEGMDCIDNNNWNKLSGIINKLKTEYSPIFLISHNDNIKQLVSNNINIEYTPSTNTSQLIN